MKEKQINLKVAVLVLLLIDLILKKSILDKFNFIGTNQRKLDLIFTNYILTKSYL